MPGVSAAAVQSASFALTLTTYADPAAMGDWVRRAQPGDEMIYAIGPAAGDHPATRCARDMSERGLVELFQRRSGKAHCFDYCARKLAVSGRPTASLHEDSRLRQQSGSQTRTALPSMETRQQLTQLLGLLRRMAERGEPCPSHSQTARELGLPSPATRGRRRAQYLFERLEAERRIAVSREGTTRTVTIIAKGRGHGKSTGETK